MQLNESAIQDLISRIRNVVEPIQVILFGSAARGDMNQDSDLDVLVVVPDSSNTRKITGDIYVALIGFSYSVDVITVTESNLKKYGENVNLIYYPALREGKSIYATR